MKSLFSRIKTIIPFALLCSILLLFIGCDSGLAYKEIETVSLPDKLIYYVGEDTSLQLAGGQIQLTTREGKTYLHDMQEYIYRRNLEEAYGITSTVNFNVPGTYEVTIWQTAKLSCSFQIEVRQSD